VDHGGPFRSRAFALLVLTSCGECDGPSWEPGFFAGDGDGVVLHPVRDSWRVEYEGPFRVNDDDGLPRIFELTIGTPNPYGDNFLNRGDVIVEFTGEPETIEIELRRFTFAGDEAAAQKTFDKLALWAFDTSLAAPKRPTEMPAESDCRDDAWHDGCGIYVYYDGLSQLERAGADIRVTLPPDYRQSLDIVTADNLVEDTYPNRGDVCIADIHANADLDVQGGAVFVKLADDTGPAPSCPPESIAACEQHPDGAWAPSCPCATQQQMGSIAIESDKPFATDIVVDVPPSLWMSVLAENEAGDSACPVTLVDLENFVADTTQSDPLRPWRIVGDANRPSDAALAGGGFALQLTSAECEIAAVIDDPDEWHEDRAPPIAARGQITVCAGCLGDSPCEDL